MFPDWVKKGWRWGIRKSSVSRQLYKPSSLQCNMFFFFSETLYAIIWRGHWTLLYIWKMCDFSLFLKMELIFFKGSWTEKLKFPWSFDIKEVIFLLKKHIVSLRTQNFVVSLKTAYIEGSLPKQHVLECSTLWWNSVDKHRLCRRRSISLPV